MTTERVDDVLTTVKNLYPSAHCEIGNRAQIWLARAERPPVNTGHLNRTFVVLLSKSRPRLIVPHDAPKAAASSVARSTPSDSAAQAAARRALAVATRLRLGRPLPQTLIWVRRSGEDSVEHHLARILGVSVEMLRISFGVGAPRANKKPVLDVHTTGGNRLAFTKLAITSLAHSLVRAEAQNLQLLHENRLRNLRVPRVLFSGEWNAHYSLVLSPLPYGRGLRRSHMPVAAMREISEVGGSGRTSVAASRWLTNLRTRAEQIDTTMGKRLRALIEDYASRHGSTSLQFGSWHGDWGPWNMSWHDGVPQVWDWERFAGPVPIGLDAMHYSTHTLLRQIGRHDLAVTALRGMAPQAAVTMGIGAAIDHPDVQATVGAYVLEMACRFCTDAAGEFGAPVERLADWHLEVLEHVGGVIAHEGVDAK